MRFLVDTWQSFAPEITTEDFFITLFGGLGIFMAITAFVMLGEKVVAISDKCDSFTKRWKLYKVDDS